MDGIDHYQVLNVRRTATPEEIKSAYRREALRWHPDRNAGNLDAERHFKAAREAYEVLRDPGKRRFHDAELADIGRKVPAARFAYGRGRGRGCGGGRGRRCGGLGGGGRRRWASAAGGPGEAIALGVSLGPLEALLGCRRSIAVESASGTQVLEIRLPPGLADGDVIALTGVGVDVRLHVSISRAM